MASGKEFPTSSKRTITASTPALRQPLGCPCVIAASSLPVVKTFEWKWSEFRSRLWEAAKYIPTGAMRITPPQPLLSFIARVTLPRLFCNAERQVVPGARRLKSFFCWSSQLALELPDETSREFCWVISQRVYEPAAARKKSGSWPCKTEATCAESTASAVKSVI